MIWIIGLFLAVAALGLGVQYIAPGVLSDQSDQVMFVKGIALLTLAAASALMGYRTNLADFARSMIIWIAIGLGLVTIYTYQDGFKAIPGQIARSLNPGRPISVAEGVRIRVSSNGHFVTRGTVGGARIVFLVDTGATNVVLTQADASRAGFDVDDLQFTNFARTANGVTRVAPVRLRQVSIGHLTIKDVRADIAGDGLDQSLLGMSFLSRLSSYEFSSRELVLQQ